MIKGSLAQLDPARARVVVAMSGGVDSSVTAALVRAAGFETVGITLQLYDHGAATQRKGACCAGQDIHDARRVAERIGIPHYVLDYESRFRESVIDDFADAYLRGETPIPCVRCNQTVKFRDLLQTARDLGADALCTGHYVQRVDGATGPELHAGADPAKDQSYFLFATAPEQLAFLHFPLGGMSKEETRAHAARLDLPVAAKPDSQDICFVPSGSYADIVEKLRPEASAPGEIVHLDGRVLGRHEGIARFTIGQRRGLGIGGTEGADAEPLYVVRIEPGTRRITVGPRRALARDVVHLAEVNWPGGAAPGQGAEIEVKLRSSGRRLPARLFVHDGGLATVELSRAEYGVSPGQACVFYDGNRVLGGGWIDDAELTALAA